ncbi:MAG: hypothetical protein FWD32_03040 [Firmicutes bacterium]|nr:hypothetical protein [Bacillota bacterium]
MKLFYTIHGINLGVLSYENGSFTYGSIPNGEEMYKKHIAVSVAGKEEASLLSKKQLNKLALTSSYNLWHSEMVTSKTLFLHMKEFLFTCQKMDLFNKANITTEDDDATKLEKLSQLDFNDNVFHFRPHKWLC